MDAVFLTYGLSCVCVCVCRSAVYNYRDFTCKLLGETRRTDPEKFAFRSRDVEFLENQCAPGTPATLAFPLSFITNHNNWGSNNLEKSVYTKQHIWWHYRLRKELYLPQTLPTVTTPTTKVASCLTSTASSPTCSTPRSARTTVTQSGTSPAAATTSRSVSHSFAICHSHCNSIILTRGTV